MKPEGESSMEGVKATLAIIDGKINVANTKIDNMDRTIVAFMDTIDRRVRDNERELSETRGSKSTLIVLCTCISTVVGGGIGFIIDMFRKH